MRECYESLGRYVTKLKGQVQQKHSIKVEYQSLVLRLSTLQSLTKFFQELKDPISIVLGQGDSPLLKTSASNSENSVIPEIETLLRRKEDMKLVMSRIEKFAVSLENDYPISSIHLLFGKKMAAFSLEKLQKSIVNSAIDFNRLIQGSPTHQSLAIRLSEQVKLRETLITGLAPEELSLAGLLKDYIRQMDLNYLDATRSYFRDGFTFSALIRRDQTNKRFTKAINIRVGEGGNVCSADLAAEYILHKLSELKIDLHLPTEAHPSTEFFEDKEQESIEPESEDRIGSPMQHLMPLVGALGRYNALICDEQLTLPSDSVEFPPLSEDKGLLTFINLIACENKIVTEYLQFLGSGLARHKAFFETRFLSPFELTSKFSQETLEVVVAFKFTDSRLQISRSLNLRVEESSDRIRFSVSNGDNAEENTPGFFDFTKSGIFGHIVSL